MPLLDMKGGGCHTMFNGSFIFFQNIWLENWSCSTSGYTYCSPSPFTSWPWWDSHGSFCRLNLTLLFSADPASAFSSCLSFITELSGLCRQSSQVVSHPGTDLLSGCSSVYLFQSYLRAQSSQAICTWQRTKKGCGDPFKGYQKELRRPLVPLL